MAKREKENADRYAREASEANRERNAALARMASWSTDKTAAQTADHYREKYEAAVKREETFARQLSKAFTTAHHRAGKRQAVHKGIDMVHDAYKYGRGE